MKVIRNYSDNIPLFTIGNDNVIREYSNNAPVCTISGNVIQKYAGNIPVYTINGNVIQKYKDNVPVYTISGDVIQKYVGNIPVYLVSSDSGSSSGISTNSSSSSDDSGVGAVLAFAFLILSGAWAIIKKIFFLFVWHFGDGGFDFKGISTRKDWWKKNLLGLLAIFLCFIIFGGIAFGLFSRASGIVQLIVLFLPVLFMFVPLIAVAVRRMHDIGKPGWFVAIPILSFIMCGFISGKVEGNPYIK